MKIEDFGKNAVDTLNEINKEIKNLESIQDDIEYSFKKSSLNMQQEGIKRLLKKCNIKVKFVCTESSGEYRLEENK